ncbi:MAG: c-type cytochrome [Phycisphaerales bacterium]|nr:c-type cytochrome [Phycisphaerales bacterium]
MIGNLLGTTTLTTAGLAEEGGFLNRIFFPERASTYAAETDHLFFFVFWVSAFFFVVLMLLMVVFAIKYRRVPGKPAQPSPSHNTLLELTWSVVPLLLMVVMFVWGWESYVKQRVPPADAEMIDVEASQWVWNFTYANGAGSRDFERISDNDVKVFALPVGRPVQFVCHSTDVIHSLYIPGFRMKIDVFPNRNTVAWAQPTHATHRMVETDDGWVPAPIEEGEEGLYLFCTEYCGDQHSQMPARIILLEEADYDKWLARQADTSSIPLKDLGAMLYVAKGCVSCHTTNGKAGTGPTWQGLWMKERKFEDGTSAVADATYIRESILEPQKHIVEGFTQQKMNSFQGRVTDRDIAALRTYIMSLTSGYEAQADEDSRKELEEKQSGGEG